MGSTVATLEMRQLWVLRSTLTLKATDTTLVSVDGDIGQRGALVHLPYASPDSESITEGPGTPSHGAIVTPTQSESHGCARPRRSHGSMWQGWTSVVTELRAKS